MKKPERHIWLMNYFHKRAELTEFRYRESWDVLNRDFVWDYIEATGAKSDMMPFGADKCPQLGRDLSELSARGMIERHRTGIGDGLCHQGFPKWVWSYRLKAPHGPTPRTTCMGHHT